MRLLEYLYEQGFYVDDEDNIKRFIAEHPHVIPALSYCADYIINNFPNATYFLEVDDEEEELVLNVGLSGQEDYKKAVLSLPFLPVEENFTVAVYLEDE